MASNDHINPADQVRAALTRYEGPLLRYAVRLVGDVEQARDVVQDTFLRLCAANEDDVDGHVTEWLYTVCRNRAIDVLRKEKRMTPLSEMQLQERPSAEPAPGARIERRETTSEMQDVMDTLPANQQEVIRLKFQDGLSYKQISEVTSYSVSNIGYLIHTGIKTLRERLNPIPEAGG